MANETLDFNDLNQSNISTDFDIGTYDLPTFFRPYHIYVEERTIGDIPKDSKTNLYDLYDAGINNLKEDDWTITASEKITSHTQMYLTNNYDTIISNFLTTTGDFNKIHYDELITELSGLEDLGGFDEMSARVMKWINEYVNDFAINQNPENADNSNLILTQALTANIQEITENILNKVFRNLMQMVRFKRDYRMYGPQSTFYGNCYVNEISCENYTAVPASCFTSRTNHYIVGKKAYEDDLGKIGDQIQNSVWHISPHTSYALAKHVHNVDINMGKLKSTIDVAKSVVSEAHEGHGPTYAASTNIEAGTSWDEQIKGKHVKGICDWTSSGTSVTIISAANYSYSWNSEGKYKSYCKLDSNSSWGANPWKNEDLRLPTYSTRVWVWSNTESSNGTNIENPTQYIHN